jgi:hypothetical protein
MIYNPLFLRPDNMFYSYSVWPIRVAAGNIAYPWRAVSAFAKAGDGFFILYDNIHFSKIDSVRLVGPFCSATLSLDSVDVGRFEYDSYTHMDVNNKIWVHVLESAPEELYDLAVHSGSEKHISHKSVKVVEKFNSPHCFILISDLHISRQRQGTAESGYAKELELLDAFIKVANIIAPDFVIITGDIIHHYTSFDSDSPGWGGRKVYHANQRPLVEEKYRNYFEGANGFSGIHGLNAPTFSTTGNHDFYGISKGDHRAQAAQWNHLCGKRDFIFSSLITVTICRMASLWTRRNWIGCVTNSNGPTRSRSSFSCINIFRLWITTRTANLFLARRLRF